MLKYLLFVFAILDNILQTLCDGMLRKDFYESLSPSKDCLEVSHYYPTGPLFLFTKVIYGPFIYKLFNDRKIQDKDIFFKKINNPCNNSLIFSAQFNNLEKINLQILVYLQNYEDLIGEFEYTFYQGILQGKYLLWDKEEHFSIRVEIFDGIQQEFITDNYMLNYRESYINSISKKRGDLCLITHYTNVVILHPRYGSIKPDGLVTRFKVIFYQNGKLVDFLNYPAFECQKTSQYPDPSTFLVLDRPTIDIRYFVVATKVFKNIETPEEYEIDIFYSKSVYIDNVGAIPKNYNKVFIANVLWKILLCVDGSERVALLSNKNKVLYVKELKTVPLQRHIEHIKYIYHPVEDKC